MTYASGVTQDEIYDKIKTDLGRMLSGADSPEPGYYEQIRNKATCTGANDKYAGYKRLDLPKRWRDGDAIGITTNAAWTKIYRPRRFGIATTITLEDKKVFDKRMGETVADNAVKEMTGRIPTFEKQTLADTLTGTTTLLEEALDLTAYDGLSLLDSTTGRFGLTTGNVIVPDADGTEPDDYKSQIFQWTKEFENMQDDFGQPFHDDTDEIMPSDLIIIASNEYKENWMTCLRSHFFPKSSAVGGTGNVFTTGGADNPLAPPEIHFNRRLSGKDYYVIYKSQKGKPLRNVYYEYAANDKNILTPNGGNPVTNVENAGASSYQFRQTRDDDKHAVMYGEGFMSMFFEITASVELPETIIQANIT